MLKIFYLKNAQLNDEGLFERCLALTDGARAEKVKSLEVRNKRNQSLAAGVILPLALKACGISGTIKVEYGQWGKPMLVQPKGLFFNLSHSGEYTVIALSDSDVGVDIQQIKPVDLRVADRYFSEEERQSIASAGSDAQELFFRYWTIKEGYLKAIGTGLNRALNSFTVRVSGEQVCICDPLCSEKWHIFEPDFAQGYKLACCSRSGGEKITPQRLILD